MKVRYSWESMLPCRRTWTHTCSTPPAVIARMNRGNHKQSPPSLWITRLLLSNMKRECNLSPFSTQPNLRRATLISKNDETAECSEMLSTFFPLRVLHTEGRLSLRPRLIRFCWTERRLLTCLISTEAQRLAGSLSWNTQQNLRKFSHFVWHKRPFSIFEGSVVRPNPLQGMVQAFTCNMSCALAIKA